MNLEKDFHSALELFQEGNYQQAENICKEILNTHPENTDALHLLGMIYYQLNDFDQALVYFHKIFYFEPSNCYALFNLGNILRSQGNPDRAEIFFRKAIESNPDFADAYYNLAIILEEKGSFEEAISAYKKSLYLDPNHADVYNNIGNLLIKNGNTDEALTYLNIALQLKPDYPAVYINMGIALNEQKRFEDAADCFRKAIKIDPDIADAYHNLAIVFKNMGNLEEAMLYSRKAIEINPDFADAHYNMGLILKEKDCMDDAIICLKKSIDLKPDFADAYTNLAIIHDEKGLLNEAIAYYEKSLKIKPDDAEVHWNMSHTLLKMGNLREGWKKYDWRFLVKEFERRTFRKHRWDGSSLKGKTLFIYAEQGVGEEIMFASCLPEIVEQADLCIIECDKRLMPIFARSFPGVEVVERFAPNAPYPQEVLHADIRTAIGSLPMFLRSDIADFPERRAYLLPDKQKADSWRKRLEELGNGLKIGISWRGGGEVSERRKRSTVLEQWSGIFSINSASFINLQYGDCAAELKEAKEKLGVTIHDWEDADPLKDLDNFAAQISALDIVISIDNATVHMAGALGVPVWTLLPFACDWRWMQDFEDSPWYPSMRLFRQNKQGDWERVFGRVEFTLRQYISTGLVPEIEPDRSCKKIISQIRR